MPLGRPLLPWGLARVHGRSMEPTLYAGDLLLVRWGARPRPGRLVVVVLPEGPDGPRPTAVKRLVGSDPGDPTRWWVERDNPREGTDSWVVGGLPDAAVLGVVVTRLPRTLARAARRR